MNLSENERLILINQYEILSRLSADEEEKKSFEDKMELLLSGYEFHYNDLHPALEEGQRTMTREESLEVLNILSMFEAIDWAVKDGIDTSGIDAWRLEFAGFDGNHESKQLGYAQFYCRPGSGKFENIVDGKGDLNSHGPHFDLYRRMVGEWKQASNPHKLTRSDLERITGV